MDERGVQACGDALRRLFALGGNRGAASAALAALACMFAAACFSGGDVAGAPEEPEPLSFAASVAPDARDDLGYAALLQLIDGVPPFSFRVSAGELPPGLALSGDSLVGTPSGAGAYVFALTVEDSSTPRRIGHQLFDLNVDATRELRLGGVAASDWFGQSVVVAGDVNGDGFPDYACGAHLTDTVATDAGSVRMCSGADGSTLWTVYGDMVGAHFGWSLGTVEDLDGDGVDEVLAGARNHDMSKGQVKLLSGSTGALLWSRIGASAGVHFGWALDGIGDVDGDGKPEFAVAALLEDSAGTNAGSVSVFSGADFQVLRVHDALEAHESFGYSLAGAGDVDADGVPDLVVGSRYADGGAVNSGRVRVFSGADGATLHQIEGEGFSYFFGTSCDGAGDVDGDGYDDVIAGAPMDVQAGVNSGAALVYSGRTGEVLHRFGGAVAGDLFGCSVAGAGDVDGDGYADLVVGSYGDDTESPDGGAARLYSGRTGQELRVLTHPEAQYCGWCVAGRGSVREDGWSALVASAPISDPAGADSGMVLAWIDRPSRPGRRVGQQGGDPPPPPGSFVPDLVFTTSAVPDARSDLSYLAEFEATGGTPPYAFTVASGALPPGIAAAGGRLVGNPETPGVYSFTITVQDSSLPPKIGHRLFDLHVDATSAVTSNGDVSGDWFGRCVGVTGDVDEDGVPDFVVATGGGDNANGVDAGVVRMCSGGDGSTLWEVLGDSPGDQLGRAGLGVVGDLDGDGVCEVVAGASMYGGERGQVKLLSGVDGDVLWTGVGATAGATFGVSCDGVGDIDLDGVPDFAVGSPYEETFGYRSGSVRVYSGADFSLLRLIESDEVWEHLGFSVAGAGDVNADGYPDIVIGAKYADAGDVDSGRVRVVSGRDWSDLYRFGGTGHSFYLGCSVDGAGDVDGDGFADIVAGSMGDTQGGASSGAAFVFSGRSGETLYRFDGVNPYDFFGCSVSAAGDVDGDGYADVIVGAYGDDTALPCIGIARVYSGRTGALLRSLCDPAGEYTGWAVAGGGSVRVDGWSILVFGAPITDNTAPDSGMAKAFIDRPSRPGRRVGQTGLKRSSNP